MHMLLEQVIKTCYTQIRFRQSAVFITDNRHPSQYLEQALDTTVTECCVACEYSG